MPVKLTEQAKREMAKAKEAGTNIEVMELRLYLSKGKLLWVEPIDPEDVTNSMAKGKKYTVDIVPNLKEEGIREVSAVAFQQDSPGCSYWYVYETRDGIVKICLQPLN
ncbi:hypothetical protein [Desulfosarcina sp.]|uniref:hypothetical protein n=1 Tax=Desulfosarcina sp. TaxID=2027861 RepID=UPI0029BB424D|nr:hypothetical protein [Desulfosarcina sp.]MDX2451558.1 hypothetical protein [Desulfosarcina sp.]